MVGDLEWFGLLLMSLVLFPIPEEMKGMFIFITGDEFMNFSNALDGMELN